MLGPLTISFSNLAQLTWPDVDWPKEGVPRLPSASSIVAWLDWAAFRFRFRCASDDGLLSAIVFLRKVEGHSTQIKHWKTIASSVWSWPLFCVCCRAVCCDDDHGLRFLFLKDTGTAMLLGFSGELGHLTWTNEKMERNDAGGLVSTAAVRTVDTIDGQKARGPWVRHEACFLGSVRTRHGRISWRAWTGN
jgi:hypothetical protein